MEIEQKERGQQAEMEIEQKERGQQAEMEIEQKQAVATAELDTAKISRQAYFQKCKPSVAILWSKKHDRGVRDFQELCSIMKGEGFRLMEDRGEWRHFRYVEGGENKRSTYRDPRLLFAKLQACHPSIYLRFLEDLAHWKGKAAAEEAFGIEIEPLGNEVAGWDDGISPCSWKNERHVIWFKSNTIDRETVSSSFSYGLRTKYKIDFESDKIEKLLRRDTAIEELIVAKKYDERVSDEWKNRRMLCFWDVHNSCAISSYEHLNRVMKDIGLTPDGVVLYLGKSEEEIDETLVAFLEITLKSHPWLYGEQGIQPYKFTETVSVSRKAEDAPWLPHPYLLGCHPLVCLHFLHKLENWVGRNIRMKTIDIKCMPLGLLFNPTGDGNFYVHTVWKGDLSVLYKRTFLIGKTLEEVGSLRKFMIRYGVDELDIKEYYADVYADTGDIVVDEIDEGTDMGEDGEGMSSDADSFQ